MPSTEPETKSPYDLSNFYKITSVSPIEKSTETLEHERRSQPLTVGAMEDIMQVAIAQILQGVQEIVNERKVVGYEPKKTGEKTAFDEINEKFGDKT